MQAAGRQAYVRHIYSTRPRASKIPTGPFFKIAVLCSYCPHCSSTVNILCLMSCSYNLQAYLLSCASSVRERKEFDPRCTRNLPQSDLGSIQNSSVGYEYAFTN